MAAGAGAGLAAVPAGAAVAAPAKAAVTRAHVSPSGTGASRAVRHVVRHAAAPAAGANIVTTRWVSNTVPVGPAPGTSCANPGYATISDALAAAGPGDTIKVCAGTYPEQLAITQSVSLVAVGAVTVAGPATPSSSLTTCDGDGGAEPNQDVVDICGTGPGSISVSVKGFTIQGGWPSDVCNDSIYGVAVLGGANLTMANSTVKNIGGDPLTDGCQGGVGIEAGLATSATTADPGTATLTNDVVNTYQKNGITVDGAGSNAAISGTVVTGAGPTPALAQNGIQISDGATAKITGSAVSGDECNDFSGGCGPDGFTQVQSAGILLFDAGLTTVSTTTVSASDIGVYNIEDFAWTFYTPPSPFTPVNDALSHLTLSNRYENAYFDEGKTTLSSSSLSGGEVGIEAAQGSYQTISSAGVAKTDTITGTNPDAILVASDNAAGDPKVKLTATGDSLDTSNAGGVANQSTSVLKVTGDWWGDATGPSGWGFGTGSSVDPDVNFFPWATDSAFSTFETCQSGLSVTTTGNDVVLCATGGIGNAFLANNGSGNVLLIGNKGNDQLNGSGTGKTWIIGGVGGSNVINGHNGTGFIQERGNASDTLINASLYTVAAK